MSKEAVQTFPSQSPTSEIQFDNFLGDAKIDAMPTGRMVGEAAWENRGYIKGTLLGLPLLLTACSSNKEAMAAGINTLSHISGAIWAAEEILEQDPNRNVPFKIFSVGAKYLAGYSGCHNTLEMKQNGGSVFSSENFPHLTSAASSATVIALLTSIPQLAAGLGERTVSKLKEGVDERNFRNDWRDMEGLIVKANYNGYSRGQALEREYAIKELHDRFSLPVYEVRRRGKRKGETIKDGGKSKINTAYINELYRDMGKDHRLQKEEARIILKREKFSNSEEDV